MIGELVAPHLLFSSLSPLLYSGDEKIRKSAPINENLWRCFALHLWNGCRVTARCGKTFGEEEARVDVEPLQGAATSIHQCPADLHHHSRGWQRRRQGGGPRRTSSIIKSAPINCGRRQETLFAALLPHRDAAPGFRTQRIDAQTDGRDDHSSRTAPHTALPCFPSLCRLKIKYPGINHRRRWQRPLCGNHRH